MEKDTINKAAEGGKIIELFLREGGNQNSLKRNLKKLLIGKSKDFDVIISSWREKADIVYQVYGVPEAKRNPTFHFDMNVRYNLVSNMLSDIRNFK